MLAILLLLWLAFAQTENPKPATYAGEGKQATEAEVNDPQAIAVYGSTLYIAESDGAIRQVDLTRGIIRTVPTKGPLLITNLVVDGDGRLLASEFADDLICRIDPRTGSVTTVAGGGGKRFQFSGDGGLAIKAELNRPSFVLLDAAGNLYIADMMNSRIRRVDAKTGIITTVAGSGKRDSSGDGGPALAAGLDFPNSVALDRDGNLFISQYGYGAGTHRIRRVDAKTGVITTVAGVAKGGSTIDRWPARSTELEFPLNLLYGPTGALYFISGYRVRAINTETQIAAAAAADPRIYGDGAPEIQLHPAETQTVTTVAGSAHGFGGDGGLAVHAGIAPNGIAMDSDGNLYIAEFENHRVRRVDARTGIIQTVAGNGFPHHLHIMQ